MSPTAGSQAHNSESTVAVDIYTGDGWFYPNRHGEVPLIDDKSVH
jgi:hypothetical protein